MAVTDSGEPNGLLGIITSKDTGYAIRRISPEFEPFYPVVYGERIISKRQTTCYGRTR
jgi:hypothetical protein